MKRFIPIWMLALLALPWEEAQASSDSDEKLLLLERLRQHGVYYDEHIPLDSIISWGEALTPQLLQQNKREDYFLLQSQLVGSYLVKGDFCLAIDRARAMYNSAKEMQTLLGDALAKQSLGDTYRASGVHGLAIRFYREALDELERLHETDDHKIALLIDLSVALQQDNRLDEAEKVMDEMLKWLQSHEGHPQTFFILTQQATLLIAQGQKQREKLDEAQQVLARMGSIYEQTHEINHQFAIHYIQGCYYLSKGVWEPSAYTKALDIFQNMLHTDMFHHKSSIYYRRISMQIIRLYTIGGQYEEACAVYRDIYSMADSIASQTYSRQISTLKTKYAIDQMAIENEEARNHTLLALISGTVLLLVLSSLMVWWLRRLKKAVQRSTKRLEQSRINAENAIRAKSVFLSNMSHEIRTPLNALSGFSSLLTEEGLDEETRLQCNEIIQQNSDLLLKLIDDVIDLSSLEFGKMQFRIAQHDAIAICHNVVDTVGKVKQTMAELLFESDMESCEIETDNSRLQQVLINLLINATKFTPEGSITLRVEKVPEKKELLFSVTDTGCGIPLEKQGKLFERFEKLNENVQGSGLGLSICQLIIEHIGGRIWIDSSYTAGARFCFTHPIRQHRRKEVAA